MKSGRTSPNVSPQVTSLGRGVGAVGTRKRLLPRVFTNVVLVVGLEYGGVGAEVAHEVAWQSAGECGGGGGGSGGVGH